MPSHPGEPSTPGGAAFRGLGTPGEIFVRLSAVAVAGTGTIALYLKVSSAVRSVTDGVTKQVDELKGKVDETVQPLVSKLPELPKLAELPKGEAAVAVPAQQEATKAPLGLPTLGFGGVGKAKAGDAAKAASEADDKAAVKRGSGDPFTVRTGDKDVVIRNPFRTPDEFSAVPPNQRNDEES